MMTRLFAGCTVALFACDQGGTAGVRIAAPADSHGSAAVAPAPPIELMPGTPSQTLRVTATLRATSDRFVLEYTVENRGPDDAYIMDISSRHDKGRVDLRLETIYLAWLGDDRAHLVQGIAPLPPDRNVDVRMIPLASRLTPDARLTRTITLARPLAEFGPYDPPAVLSSSEPRYVDELVITVVALRPSAPGFRVAPVDRPFGAYRVASQYTVGHVERASTTVALPARTMLRTFRSSPATFTRVR